MASGAQMLDQLRAMVSELSTKQKLILAAGSAVTVALLLFFVRSLSKPEFKPLYTNMEPADAQALVKRLTEKSIPYEESPDSKTVSVPSDKLDAARLELASGGMPQSGRLGFELFDKINWGETEFDEKVNYQRALEGELERTIQKLKNVDSVRVHLVMATDSLFADRERSGKASVILNLKSGHITPDMQMAISRLISGAVDKLPPENVAIIDANEGRPALPGEHDSNSLAGSMETDLAAKILNTLGPVVGPDSVRANVNVEYDPTSAEESQETYDPKAVVAVSTQRSDEQMGGTADAGIPGTSSNVPGASTSPKSAAPAGQNTQSTHSESNSYAVSKVVRHVLQPSGRVRRISAAVVVDDAIDVSQVNGKRTENRRKRTADELKQIEQLASAAVGLDTTRGDVLAVQNLTFRQPEIDAPTKPTTAQKVRVIVTDWSTAIRYGLLALLFVLAYFFILRPVKKQVVLALKDAGASLLAKAQASQENAKLPASEHALLLRQKLVDRVKAEPAAAGQLVKSLLSEGKS